MLAAFIISSFVALLPEPHILVARTIRLALEVSKNRDSEAEVRTMIESIIHRMRTKTQQTEFQNSWS